jgi:hypothetical protein
MYLPQRTQSITQSAQKSWLDVYNDIIKSPKLILCETFVPFAVKTKKTNFMNNLIKINYYEQIY